MCDSVAAVRNISAVENRRRATSSTKSSSWLTAVVGANLFSIVQSADEQSTASTRADRQIDARREAVSRRDGDVVVPIPTAD